MACGEKTILQRMNRRRVRTSSIETPLREGDHDDQEFKSISAIGEVAPRLTTVDRHLEQASMIKMPRRILSKPCNIATFCAMIVGLVSNPATTPASTINATMTW